MNLLFFKKAMSSKPPAEEYRAIGRVDKEMSEPAILVKYYEKGVWKEDKICPAPMIIEEFDNYDDRSLTLMVQELCKNCWGVLNENTVEMLGKFAREMEKRIAQRKKDAEEWRKAHEGDKEPAPANSSWKRREEFYMGKSLIQETVRVPLLSMENGRISFRGRPIATPR